VGEAREIPIFSAGPGNKQSKTTVRGHIPSDSKSLVSSSDMLKFPNSEEPTPPIHRRPINNNREPSKPRGYLRMPLLILPSEGKTHQSVAGILLEPTHYIRLKG
jgi:hypothetical protein